MQFELPDIQIEAYVSELAEITSKLQDPALSSDYMLMGKLNAEYKRISAVVNAWNDLIAKIKSYQESEALAEDPELGGLAASELQTLEPQISKLIFDLNEMTLPRLPHDESNAIIEIRAGTGGTEASLFAEEVFRMYSRYINSAGLSSEQLSTSYNDDGGIKEVTFQVNGDHAYGKLRFESGVHRVQRVPATESSGRIHTSTISVVIMPEIKGSEIQVNQSDLKIDVYRSSGPGGQSVNTTDSAVRITHLPSGIVVTCQDSKSQHKNKEKAMSVLMSKLYAIQQEKEQSEVNSIRNQSIQGGDRSAKIRTYNFPQGRVTDHRIKQTWYNIPEIMEGNISEIVETVNKILRKGGPVQGSDADDDE